MQLLAFFSDVYRPRRLAGRRTRTAYLYLLAIRQFSEWLGREPMLADLSEDALVRFLDQQSQNGWAPATVNRSRSQFLSMARFASARGFLAVVPDLTPYPEPRHIPAIYGDSDVAKLLDACQWFDGTIHGVPRDRWWVACLLLSYDTGARPGAILQLRWQDVGLSVRTILLRAATQKQNSDQIIRIHPNTVAALRAIASPLRELVLPWNAAPTQIYYWFDRLHRLAGVPLTKSHKFRKYRVTCATLAHRAGLDASAQLGHSDPRVTRRHYIAPEPSGAADVIPRPVMPAWLTSPNKSQQLLF